MNFTPVPIQSLLKLELADLKTFINGICTGCIFKHQTYIESVLLTLNKPRLQDLYQHIDDKLLFRGCMYSSKDHFGTFVKQEYCLCWEQMYLKEPFLDLSCVFEMKNVGRDRAQQVGFFQFRAGSGRVLKKSRVACEFQTG